MPLPEILSGVIALAVQDEVLERARGRHADREMARVDAIMADFAKAEVRRDANAAASLASRNVALGTKK